MDPLLSIETFAFVFLPAAVDDQRHHAQHAKAQDGEEEGEEQLQSAHSSSFFHFDCKVKATRSLK